jgi:hypothetical protein
MGKEIFASGKIMVIREVVRRTHDEVMHIEGLARDKVDAFKPFATFAGMIIIYASMVPGFLAGAAQSDLVTATANQVPNLMHTWEEGVGGFGVLVAAGVLLMKWGWNAMNEYEARYSVKE